MARRTDSGRRAGGRGFARAAWALALAGGAAFGAPETGSKLQASPEALEWWREARFGLFIHWGPVSLKGTEIGWSRGGERRGTGGTGAIPVEVYDNLYKEFNPVEFDADEWVAIAKAAGMKYLVFTTKHHDGFSMFDSSFTEYKITNSPFKRDVVAELARACHAAGLRLGFYYSPPDWHHPDYRTPNHARYIEYLHGQLRELCTRYGKVDIIWFDGLGGKAADWGSERLIPMIRDLQPGVLINNRAGVPADFDTPEQRVGRFQIDRPWESCMTICRQWAWKPNDRMKTLKECLDIFVRCAGGDGNLLLNVGPMPTGEIEPRQVERLKEMGAWIAKYGESIYGTRGGPFRPAGWGASTRKGNRIYVHILLWEGDALSLPAIPKKIVGSRVLTGGEARILQTADGIEIRIPREARQEIDTIVALDLDGPASEIAPVATRIPSLATGKKAAASNTFQNSPAYAPAKAFDDDEGTRWATDAGTSEAFLEVDLGAAATFDRVTIREAFDRVRVFELQAKEGDAWKTFAKGTRIGDALELRFAPVTAQVVRLLIRKATEGPTIWEFGIHAPKK
ncbi:MAG: alpha-L-fucosidase [Planctomycetes bacterium]|nr:alpha-L-fucosidase [Planctomycetota bacterium]